jgi:hypothetical protein
MRYHHHGSRGGEGACGHASFYTRTNVSVTLRSGESKPCLPAVLTVSSDTRTAATLQLSEGKFHQVKRMMHTQGQGLTHVHFIAQPKPFCSHLPVSPCLIDWGKIMHPIHPTKCASVEPKSGRV